MKSNNSDEKSDNNSPSLMENIIEETKEPNADDDNTSGQNY